MSYFTNEGLRVPRENEVLDLIRAEYESLREQSIDWSRDTFEGAFSLAVARVLAENADGIQVVWDLLDLENATGAALDEIHGPLAGVQRVPATFSVVSLDLDGTGGTVVPEGKVVEDTNGTRWVLSDNVVLPGSVAAQATEVGPLPAAAGTITEIVTPVTGWDSVTNPDPATPGTRRQSDADFRVVIRRARQRSLGSSFGGIEERVRRLSFITDALVVHNPTNDPQTVRGVDLNPHSFSVIVFPDVLTQEQKDALVDRIFEFAPVGIESIGDESEFRAGWPVRFSFAEDISVDVSMTIVVTGGFAEADVIADVEDAIERLFAQLAVGEDVRILALYGAVDRVSGVEAVTALEIDGAMADFEVAATEYAQPGTLNVSV